MMADVDRAYAQLRGQVVSRHGDEAGGALDVVFALADRVHRGERRRSGDPYVTHPIEVASYVNAWSLPLPCVLAALAHDVPDSAGRDAWAHTLDGPVLAYVEAFQALADPPVAPAAPTEFEQHVLALKVADRLLNARTWRFVPREKARLKAHETLTLIAPVAASLRQLDIAAELRELSRAVLAEPVPHLADHHAVRRAAGASGLVSTALSVLPPELRERYRQEWSADLAHLDTRRERLAMSLGLLWSAWTIRRQHQR